jgi:hypothetical protein
MALIAEAGSWEGFPKIHLKKAAKDFRSPARTRIGATGSHLPVSLWFWVANKDS